MTEKKPVGTIWVLRYLLLEFPTDKTVHTKAFDAPVMGPVWNTKNTENLTLHSGHLILQLDAHNVNITPF